MSNSKWDAFKNWLYRLIADLIPETSKRFVLYELNDRAALKIPEDKRDFWSITTEQMYDEIRD